MTVHQQVIAALDKMKAKQRAETKLQLPPNCVHHLETRYLAYQPGKHLVGESPFKTDFTTPIGSYQGGILLAAIDNVYGPLSYLIMERPMATIELQASYMRPFFPSDVAVIVEVKVMAKTKNLLFMEAVAKSKVTGKVFATSKTTLMVVAQK